MMLHILQFLVTNCIKMTIGYHKTKKEYLNPLNIVQNRTVNSRNKPIKNGGNFQYKGGFGRDQIFYKQMSILLLTICR